jgi:hypothetical protein
MAANGAAANAARIFILASWSCSAMHPWRTEQDHRLSFGASARRRDAKKSVSPESAEEKFAIVIEGLKSGNVAETCHNHNIAAAGRTTSKKRR